MNYSGILKDNMLNGEGLRVVLFVSGCNHQCKNCHNPQTWDETNGELFTEDTVNELYDELKKDYISGITISGGDPLFITNIKDVSQLCKRIKMDFPNKTIWLYTGSTFSDITSFTAFPIIDIMKNIDVIVDGEYIEELSDVNYPYAGSTNQRVIDVVKSFDNKKITFYTN